MIAIIDYGLGNVLAFENVYKRLNIPARIARVPEDLRSATRLVLPGVGAFDHAMARFALSGLRDPVEELVRDKRIPVLGVCVGMQMLANDSDEGALPGLGWVPGRVKRLANDDATRPLRLPHMGWNDVTPARDCGLFGQLQSAARFYFLHSYHFVPADAESVVAKCEYGVEIACAVRVGNVFGVQFHPEKSHHFGAQLLRNFAEQS